MEEVGMISTRLLNSEKNPIVVPNAFFTSQVCQEGGSIEA